MTEAKRGRGRPATWEYPERIDASPEETAQAMFEMPADHKWRYLEEAKPEAEKWPRPCE